MKHVNIGNRVLNNWLIEAELGWVAVDTGYAGGMGRFLSRLGKHGVAPHDIKFIFLSHAHDDHAVFFWGGGLMLLTQRL